MCEIADTIERDIARALQPKPEKVYENYCNMDYRLSYDSIYRRSVSAGNSERYSGYVCFKNS